MMKDLKFYVINLARSTDRRKTVSERLQKVGVDFTFVAALDGLDSDFPFSRYSHYYAPFWGRTDSFKPGAFACYLSHASCWEAIANGKEPYAVVLEDDIEIDADRLEAFDSRVLDRPFDVVFINQRTERWIAAAPGPRAGALVELDAVLESLILSGEFADKVRAPGTDGYVISRRGASKLLHILRTRKACMGVDYAIALNSMPHERLEKLAGLLNEMPRELAFHLETERRSGDDTHLQTFIYNRGAIVRSDGSPSTLGHGLKVGASVFSADAKDTQS